MQVNILQVLYGHRLFRFFILTSWLTLISTDLQIGGRLLELYSDVYIRWIDQHRLSRLRKLTVAFTELISGVSLSLALQFQQSWRKKTYKTLLKTRNTLDCDQSNYSSRIVFSHIPVTRKPLAVTVRRYTWPQRMQAARKYGSYPASKGRKETVYRAVKQTSTGRV